MLGRLLTRAAHAFALALTLVVLSSTAAADSTQATKSKEFDARIERELRARDPAAADEFQKANAAREAQRWQEAEAGYGAVIKLAPWYSHAKRRMCGALIAQGRYDDGIAMCERAVEQESSVENLAALALALGHIDAKSDLVSKRPADTRAISLAREAAERDPSDSYSRQALVFLELRNNYYDAAYQHAQQLEPLLDHDKSAIAMTATTAIAAGKFDEAERHIARAQAAGLSSAEVTRLRKLLRDVQEDKDRGGLPTWVRQLGWALGGWACFLAALFVIGSALSSATLSAVRRSDAKSGEAVGGEVWLKRLYRIVLWVASLAYYLSLPLVFVVVIGGTIGVVWLTLAIGYIPIKLLLIIIVIAGLSIFSMLKGLFVKTPDEEPGERLDLAQEPKLRATLNAVAEKIKTRPVDTVFMTTGTELAVFERGGFLKSIQGRSERCLIVGAGVLDGMRARAFRSILAHEYGHFRNEDTAGGGIALAVRRTIFKTAHHLAQSGAASVINPAWQFLRLYGNVFLRISQGASRLQEILADRWAALAYGSAAFVEGLTHVIRRETSFGAHVNATLSEVIEQKLALANLYSYQPATPPEQDKIESEITDALNATPSPFDSHPSPADRIAAVEGLDIAPPSGDDAAADAEQAWDLFADRVALEKKMTARARERLAEKGIVVKHAE